MSWSGIRRYWWWPWPPWRPKPPTPPGPVGDWKAEMLSSHNSVRSSNRLSLLRANTKLDASAQEGIDICARNGRLDHGDPWARMRAHGYNYSNASENMAEGQANATQVVNDWIRADPGHRANVLGPWVDVGFGRAIGRDGQIYWAADYGTPQ